MLSVSTRLYILALIVAVIGVPTAGMISIVAAVSAAYSGDGWGLFQEFFAYGFPVITLLASIHFAREGWRRRTIPG